MATIPGVSNNELIRTTWGNTVAVELNTRSVKVNGAIGDGTGNQWMTGSLVIRPASATCLRLQNGANNPYVNWESNAATPIRYGYIQGTTAGLLIRADGTGRVVDISDLVASDLFKANAGVWVGGNGSQVNLIDVSGGGNGCYMALYGNGTMTTPGTRSGYVGFPSSTTLTMLNELSGGAIALATTGSGAINLSTAGAGAVTLQTGVNGDINVKAGPSGEVLFEANDTYVGRVANGRILVGKTTTNAATVGLELIAGGAVYSTHDTEGAPNVYCRHEGAANADGEQFARFMVGATQVGRIEQNGGSGVSYITSSDRRLKTVVGPIGDAVDRVKALKPVRVTWNGDAARGETDAFIADEVTPVVPDAVSGTKDEVDGDGAPVMQGLDYSKLVTVSVAAIQELIARIEELTARVDELEAAAP